MLIPHVIPLSFVLSIRSNIGWKQIAWGYHNGLLGWRSLVEFADHRIWKEFNEAEEELLHLGKADIEELTAKVDSLAAKDGGDSDQKEFWLVVVLTWYFKNNAGIDDALDKAEMVYESFGSPGDVESFVRYAPVTDTYNPLEHTREENLARLMSNWKVYLERRGVDLAQIS